MKKLYLLAGLATVLLPQSVFAGSVQLQSFGDVQISGDPVTSLPAKSRHRQALLLDATADRVEPSLAEAGTGPSQQSLATAFSGLDSNGEDERSGVVARPASSIRSLVPTWMRRRYPLRGGGTSRFFSSQRRFDSSYGSSSTLLPPSYSGCANQAYHPKGAKAEVEARRARYFPVMVAVACQVGVPVELFDALLTQESGYNPMALSAKGATGIAQLMPGTARTFGVFNVWDPIENMRGGARVLKSHLDEFGRYDLALAAYNAGAGRVRERGGVPRIRETVDYVGAILGDVRRQFQQAAYYVAHGL